MREWMTAWVHKLRRSVSRSEWAVRLLALTRSPKTQTEPGLIVLQIDGLSRHQMEHAMQSGRLPFLKRLLDEEEYQLLSLYAGLPSSTPAVQGEIFYGVRCGVPAFGFRDHETGKAASMFSPQDAKRVEQRLASAGEGLFQEGGAYADIYTGGAKIASFCTTSLGLGSSFREANVLALLITLLLHSFMLLRSAALIGIEVGLALIDFFRGLLEEKNLLAELKFIPSRVGISILLRELATMGIMIDAARGLPIIHCTFLGYDEQSHRRGPSSKFAHWTLKGIDGCIKRIWRSAKRSACRDYELWIYSDHGQEATTPYEKHSGKKLDAAIMEVLKAQIAGHDEMLHTQSDTSQLDRANLLGGERLQRLLSHVKSWSPTNHIEIT
ncbi:oxidoreductase, partial [candidate division KSB3 bacterium]|nr:oxidoreductase [candidate division KSB3 bacterium]MBD3326041.1 oxidoreductase [candidate division KSB3 bacterium]